MRGLTASAVSPSAHTAPPAPRAATSRRDAAPSRLRSAVPPRSAAQVRRQGRAGHPVKRSRMRQEGRSRVGWTIWLGHQERAWRIAAVMPLRTGRGTLFIRVRVHRVKSVWGRDLSTWRYARFGVLVGVGMVHPRSARKLDMPAGRAVGSFVGVSGCRFVALGSLPVVGQASWKRCTRTGKTSHGGLPARNSFGSP